jgi:hypothetical protein
MHSLLYQKQGETLPQGCQKHVPRPPSPRMAARYHPKGHPPNPYPLPPTLTHLAETPAPSPPTQSHGTPLAEYINQLLDLQTAPPQHNIWSKASRPTIKGGRTARPTVSPVASAFVPSPTPSPFPTPSSLPSFYMISDNHTSSPTVSTTIISDDLVISVDTKARTPLWFTSMELRFTSKSTFPPFMDFKSHSHHPLQHPQTPEAPAPKAFEEGSVTDSSMPSLVSPSLSSSSSLSSPMTQLYDDGIQR